MLDTRTLTPVETRAQRTVFVTRCSFQGLRPQLPLRWPTPPETPPSPKRRYRSWYTPPKATELAAADSWQDLAPFDLLLRLVDFSPLRDVLAQLLGWASAKGQIPFDPVSLFLLLGWQLTHRWSRTQTLKNLRKTHYADYAQRFGFRDGVYPTEGGVRYFLTTLGLNSPDPTHPITLEAYGASPETQVVLQRLNVLLIQAAYLLRQHGFISDVAWTQALICPDGMLHPAASRLRCTSVTSTCYQPAPRPCPAQDKGHQGCHCDTLACVHSCQHAPPRDPDARWVWYSGSNQPASSPNRHTTTPELDSPKSGTAVYGYCSLALRLADPVQRISLSLLSDFGPATLNEADHAAALWLQLPSAYPDLQLAAVAGDAAYGYDRPLHLIYTHLHARRFVALRAHQCDRDKSLWVTRGYDARGRPVCPFGYRFTANGYDPQRRRSKWCCAQACLRDAVAPAICLPDVSYPPPECPFQAVEHAPHGQIFNLAELFPDQSIRLARDAPVGSRTWKTYYHRARNAIEARNSVLEDWQLKRLPYFGTPRNRALIALADTFDSLLTLARLCREATVATGFIPN